MLGVVASGQGAGVSKDQGKLDGCLLLALEQALLSSLFGRGAIMLISTSHVDKSTSVQATRISRSWYITASTPALCSPWHYSGSYLLTAILT